MFGIKEEEAEMVTNTMEKITFNRLSTTVINALPKGALSIEDMVIKGNRVIVRYKTQRDQKPENGNLKKDNRVVGISSFDALRLDDGKVVEHRDTIYQIKKW